MASLHRDPRFPKGVWYTAYRLATGQRVFRSTGKHKKSEARLIADAWEAAEKEAARGELTKDRVTAILNDTLIRLGQVPVENISVRQWMEKWLEGKKPSLAPTSFASYSQTIREFLEHLGENGASRKLDSITEIDIQGFLESLRQSGRAPATINKLRAFLSSPFEKARKVGRISFNPVQGTNSEKSDASPSRPSLPRRSPHFCKSPATIGEVQFCLPIRPQHDSEMSPI
jgi:hypothetical protein